MELYMSLARQQLLHNMNYVAFWWQLPHENVVIDYILRSNDMDGRMQIVGIMKTGILKQ